MANVSREAKKDEALKRMKMLDIFPTTQKEFREEDKLNESEGAGILYWLNDEEQEMVRKFEEEYDALVYHVIHSLTNIGEMYALLYVSDHPDEWDMDNEDLQGGRDVYPIAYVINKDYPDCSELGGIGVRKINGGLMRIA